MSIFRRKVLKQRCIVLFTTLLSQNWSQNMLSITIFVTDKNKIKPILEISTFTSRGSPIFSTSKDCLAHFRFHQHTQFILETRRLRLPNLHFADQIYSTVHQLLPNETLEGIINIGTESLFELIFNKMIAFLIFSFLGILFFSIFFLRIFEIFLVAVFVKHII